MFHFFLFPSLAGIAPRMDPYETLLILLEGTQKIPEADPPPISYKWGFLTSLGTLLSSLSLFHTTV